MTNSVSFRTTGYAAATRVRGTAVPGATQAGSPMGMRVLAWDVDTTPVAGAHAFRSPNAAGDLNPVGSPNTIAAGMTEAALTKQGAPPRGEPR
jgi:hypothetical protein